MYTITKHAKKTQTTIRNRKTMFILIIGTDSTKIPLQKVNKTIKSRRISRIRNYTSSRSFWLGTETLFVDMMTRVKRNLSFQMRTDQTSSFETCSSLQVNLLNELLFISLSRITRLSLHTTRGSFLSSTRNSPHHKA